MCELLTKYPFFAKLNLKYYFLTERVAHISTVDELLAHFIYLFIYLFIHFIYR